MYIWKWKGGWGCWDCSGCDRWPFSYWGNGGITLKPWLACLLWWSHLSPFKIFRSAVEIWPCLHFQEDLRSPQSLSYSEDEREVRKGILNLKMSKLCKVTQYTHNACNVYVYLQGITLQCWFEIIKSNIFHLFSRKGFWSWWRDPHPLQEERSWWRKEGGGGRFPSCRHSTHC